MDTDDLALACAGLGTISEDDYGKLSYVKGQECVECLKDLQRFMRRDHPKSRDIFMQLSKWNTLRQDLVPLIMRYNSDHDIVVNCVKVIVFLTMPLEASSDNFAQQCTYLHQMKEAFLGDDTLVVILSHLEEPLQHLECGAASDGDWRTFQLFLTLLRNLLRVPDSVSPQAGGASNLMYLKDKLLERLFRESVTELVLALIPHVAERGALRQDNFVFLEIIYFLFWGQLPDSIATAADKDAKVESQSQKSSELLHAMMQKEREELRALRMRDVSRHTPFSGMFVRVGKDGSKAIVTRSPYSSMLESSARKPQIKRGPTKPIAKENRVLLPSTERIRVQLKDFAIQFFDTGYNLLMQTIKDDIRREVAHVETADVMIFFQVVQFCTSFQCCLALKGQKQGTMEVDSLAGDLQGISSHKQLCGMIASTMDEEMFNLLISRWHTYVDYAKETKEWGPLTAAGALMKEMIRMLDLVMKRDGLVTQEVEREVRVARILLYKVFYDQTDQGILHFLLSLIKSFDIHKQPRSHLADLVEIAHTVLRILEEIMKEGTLKVLQKVRGGCKKAKSVSSQPDAALSKDKSNVDTSEGLEALKTTEELTGPSFVEENRLAEENAAKVLVSDPEPVLLQTHEQEDDNEEEELYKEVYEEEDSDKEKTKEVNLDMHKWIRKFADNTVVRNYCWLLKFYTHNSAATNYHIVRMLQRVSEDCVLEPMLYQLSLLQVFYGILSNKEIQGAEEHKFLVDFLTRLVRHLFKKLKDNPLLFVELLFWKTKRECHDITVDYMIHSLKKGSRSSTSSRQRMSIKDALGDDEEDALPFMQAANEEGEDGEAGFQRSDDDNEPIIQHKVNPNTDIQDIKIKELFEKFSGEQNYVQLIANELSVGKEIPVRKVIHRLRQLGLQKTDSHRGAVDALEIGESADQKKKGLAIKSASTTEVSERVKRKRSVRFNEHHDAQLQELFKMHMGNKKSTKLIAGSMGGEFTAAQVSRRLRILGLRKPARAKTKSSLLSDVKDSGDESDRMLEDTIEDEDENVLRSVGFRKKLSTVHISDQSDRMLEDSFVDENENMLRPVASRKKLSTVHIGDESDKMLEDSVEDEDENVLRPVAFRRKLSTVHIGDESDKMLEDSFEDEDANVLRPVAFRKKLSTGSRVLLFDSEDE